MKQYGIYRINNGGIPFLINKFDSLISAQLFINECVFDWDNKNMTYYIDNEFFTNKYSRSEANFYCRIKVREITDWQELSNEKGFTNDNNVIDFYSYKKIFS